MSYKPLPIADWNEYISTLTEEEYLALSPFRRRNCAECVHLKAAVSFWCTNKEAIAARGTSIPGVANCHYWGPDWRQISKEYRAEENGYTKPISFWRRLFKCVWK